MRDGDRIRRRKLEKVRRAARRLADVNSIRPQDVRAEVLKHLEESIAENEKLGRLLAL
jgi:hypothetical protein